MKLITSAPIYVNKKEVSSFDGDEMNSFATGDKNKSAKKKEGFFSKEKHAERIQKREVRQEKRAERRADRKAKYGARPLVGMTKAGVQKFKDKLPKLHRKVKESGEEVFEKQMPDGQIKELTKAAVQTVGTGDAQTFFDKADINTPKEVVQTKLPDGTVDLHKEYDSTETETVADANGVESVYKKDDVEDKKGWSALSTPVKIGIVIGSVAVIGIIGYMIYKKRKK